MNLIESKEHFLGNYNHDFPRLAKQSGFIFQLHRGKVNWSEIECLNLDDIIENRNFELLEQNLLNVINCNLERDYDLKILDQNFVKLFKLAQLGIDYLSYCELYLDRCVILLQEQLMSIQEEFESLKNENEGKNLELKKPKSKKKINNYQCEKCEKAFISDVYLKFHDKRRHSNLSTPESKEGLLTKSINASQQTERRETLSVSVQTLLDESATAFQKNEDIRKIKKSHNKKIKELEKNLNDVKARLKKAEKSLQETKEANSNSVPVNYPSSVHYHPLLQFMPPCFHPSRNIDEAIAEYQKSFPKSRSPISDLVINIDRKVSEGQKSPVSGDALLKESNAGGAEQNSEITKTDFVCNKENINPQNTVYVTKPHPPPRKTKKKFQNALCTEENLTTETFNQLNNGAHSVTDIVPLSEQSVDFTAVKGTSGLNIHSENMEDINGKITNSNESVNVNREKSEEELTSFFKKVVGKSSPKFQKLSKNLRRPLTNLYDSVSSTGKNLMNIEKKPQDVKCALVDDLHSHLRELGIDPEWKGIPKKTMKQKLKDLTRRRKLLSKENPLYASVRQRAEEKIFEKLKKKFFLRKTLPQKSCNEEMEEDVHPTKEKSCFKSEKSENARNRNCIVLCDADLDSWPKVSELEKNQRKQPFLLCHTDKPEVSESDSEEKDALKMGKKKSNTRLFQIINGSMDRQGKFETDMKVNEAAELSTNSDFEDDFSICSDVRFVKSIDVKNDYEKLPAVTEVAQVH